MKKTILDDVLNCLETGEFIVELDENVAKKASESLQKMLSVR